MWCDRRNAGKVDSLMGLKENVVGRDFRAGTGRRDQPSAPGGRRVATRWTCAPTLEITKAAEQPNRAVLRRRPLSWTLTQNAKLHDDKVGRSRRPFPCPPHRRLHVCGTRHSGRHLLAAD